MTYAEEHLIEAVKELGDKIDRLTSMIEKSAGQKHFTQDRLENYQKVREKAIDDMLLRLTAAFEGIISKEIQ